LCPLDTIRGGPWPSLTIGPLKNLRFSGLTSGSSPPPRTCLTSRRRVVLRVLSRSLIHATPDISTWGKGGHLYFVLTRHRALYARFEGRCRGLALSGGSGANCPHGKARRRVLVRFRLQLRLLRLARSRGVDGEAWPDGCLAAVHAGRRLCGQRRARYVSHSHVTRIRLAQQSPE